MRGTVIQSRARCQITKRAHHRDQQTLTRIAGLEGAPGGSREPCGALGQFFRAPPLHGRWDPHRLAVLRDGPPRDVDTVAFQSLHNLIVGQNRVRRLRVDQLADAVADGLRGMCRTIARRGNRRGKKVLELEYPAGRPFSG
jgi:hypothetical protein